MKANLFGRRLCPTTIVWFLVCFLWAQPVVYHSSVFASPLSGGPWGPTDPVADHSAIIIVAGPTGSHIRFTVLTDRMLRIEQSSPSKAINTTTQQEATFEDRKTVAVINRKLPVPLFHHSQSNNGLLRLETSCLRLSYRIGAPLSALMRCSWSRRR